MKIRKILLAVVIAFSFSTCDKIDPPYREPVVVSDFCATGIDDSIPNRKVLVEDYTGHACGNCPPAGVYLNDSLKPLYNHCLVVISVHAGFFAGTCPSSLVCMGLSHPPTGSFTTDFNTTIGTAWNSFFGITANPKGMVNRIEYPNGTHSKTYSAWLPAIVQELAIPASATLSINNNYNSATRTVDVAVESVFLENLPDDYKLQVVITEDSLPDWQLWYGHDPDEYVADYVHRHVLRDGLNTTWGDVLATGGVTGGTSVSKNYSYTINNAWNVDHCNIVAFIYKADTYEVLQVEEKAVK